MSSTNVPKHYLTVRQLATKIDQNGRTIPDDLKEENYGDNSEMKQAIEGGLVVQIDATGYDKFKAEKTEIIIGENGKLLSGDLSKLTKSELTIISEKYPEILKMIGDTVR